MTDSLPARPLLNPVLTLRKTPVAKDAAHGGKKAAGIVTARLAQQRNVLSAQARGLYQRRATLKAFDGRFLLLARMFEDSIAKSHTPGDLFLGPRGTRLIAPASKAYVVEMEVEDLPTLANTILTTTTIGRRYDISRVEEIRTIEDGDVLRGVAPDALWKQASVGERGRGFILWLPPFRSEGARLRAMEKLRELSDNSIFLPTYPRIQLLERPRREGDGDDTGKERALVAVPVISDSQNSLAVAQREYRGFGHARTLVEIPSADALAELAASGGAFRLDPVSDISVTAPGEGQEPGPLPATIGTEPIVGVVDGGRTARRYDRAEAWREPALVPSGLADHAHGNQVTGIVVHGHEWNDNLALPELHCRVGTVQAVPKLGAAFRADPAQLISYLEAVFRRHPETRVWNLSWNEKLSVQVDVVSYIGHELAKLARKHRVLLVISAGNVSNVDGARLAPPADCEAGLIVGGRQYNSECQFLGPCPESLPGLGPEGLLVPHVSYYSPLRLLGGNVVRATSFPTGLISSVAAHTFENLKDPSPDFVRALIINQTDLDKFDCHLGWGSPHPEHLPWHCRPGTVTLAWTARLRPGFVYYCGLM